MLFHRSVQRKHQTEAYPGEPTTYWRKGRELPKAVLDQRSKLATKKSKDFSKE